MHDGIQTLEHLCRLIREAVRERALARQNMGCATIELVEVGENFHGPIRCIKVSSKPKKPNYLKITFGILHDTVGDTHIDYDRVAEITVFEWTGETKLRLWLSGSPIWAENHYGRMKLASAGNNPLRDVCIFYEIAAEILPRLEKAHDDLTKE